VYAGGGSDGIDDDDDESAGGCGVLGALLLGWPKAEGFILVFDRTIEYLKCVRRRETTIRRLQEICGKQLKVSPDFQIEIVVRSSVPSVITANY
jgi:hypothetical protein